MKNRKGILRWTIIVLTVIVSVSVGGGTYFFDFAIVRKAPVDGNYFQRLKESSAEWIEPQTIEQLTITSHDGLRLRGYLFPADTVTNRLAIVVHGHRDGVKRMLGYIRMFHEEGFNVFSADNRGHDSSEGRYVGFGWLDRLDYLQWLDLLIERYGGDVEIVMHGHSMGAATVMMTSGEASFPKQVKAVIEDCGFTSVKEEFDYQARRSYHLPSFPVVDIADIESQVFAGYGFKEADALVQIAKSTTPTFFIHGDADTYVPTEMAYRLFDAASRCEKELWIVPGAAHVKSFTIDPDEYRRRCKIFYSKYLFQ